MESVAPISPAIAARPIPSTEGGLAVGQVVRARVARVDGDVVQLRLGEQTVAVATRVPLTPGQQVSLLVEEGTAGKMLLRMVDDTFGRARTSQPERGNSQSRGPGSTMPGTGSRPIPLPGVSGRPGQGGGEPGRGGQQFSGGSRQWAGGPAAGGPATGTQPPGNLAESLAEADGLAGMLFERAETAGPRPMPGAGPRLVQGRQAPIPLRPDVTVPGAAAQPSSQGPGATVRPGAATPGAAAPPTVLNPAAPALPNVPTLGATLRPTLVASPSSSAGERATATTATAPGLAQLMDHTAEALHSPVALAATGLLARAALPKYGRLAQSVGGSAAFGAMLASLGREVGQTMARAPLAPSDLGRLLVDVGVHPDEMNAVLVSEMLTQGSPVTEASVRGLRRDLGVAGGGLTDAEPAVLLSKLGLPVTPLSLAVARQMLAGQLDPPATWSSVLPDLQRLARERRFDGSAGQLANELVAGWRVPLEEGVRGIERWLRAAVEAAATPPEAKLAQLLALTRDPTLLDSQGLPLLDPKPTSPAAPPTTGTGPELDPRPAADARPAQDTRLAQDARPTPERAASNLVPARTPAEETLRADLRTRLAALTEALPSGTRGERGSLSFGLQRLQATVQAEQVLNGAATERAEPRFFAVTLPTFVHQQPGTISMRVREREARPGARVEATRPDVVHLKLDLPGLGNLGVSLTIGKSSVNCHFSAASPFAEALLSASSGELEGRLKRLGYQNATIDAAHEAPEPAPSLQTTSPRVQHVDVKA